MKRILLCLMVALFATGCLFAKNNDEKMNVMSYNIRYDNSGDKDNQWKFRRDFAADLVKFYEADVFGAQEVVRMARRKGSTLRFSIVRIVSPLRKAVISG